MPHDNPGWTMTLSNELSRIASEHATLRLPLFIPSHSFSRFRCIDMEPIHDLFQTLITAKPLDFLTRLGFQAIEN